MITVGTLADLNMLVTFDKRDFEQARVENLRIVSPREALQELRSPYEKK